MSKEILRWEDAFTDVEYLQLMYYLAKHNPGLTGEEIAKARGWEQNKVLKMLICLSNLNIVKVKDEEYALTPKGLASLYNFHTNFNR